MLEQLYLIAAALVCLIVLGAVRKPLTVKGLRALAIDEWHRFEAVHGSRAAQIGEETFQRLYHRELFSILWKRSLWIAIPALTGVLIACVAYMYVLSMTLVDVASVSFGVFALVLSAKFAFMPRYFLNEEAYYTENVRARITDILIGARA